MWGLRRIAAAWIGLGVLVGLAGDVAANPYARFVDVPVSVRFVDAETGDLVQGVRWGLKGSPMTGNGEPCTVKVKRLGLSEHEVVCYPPQGYLLVDQEPLRLAMNRFASEAVFDYPLRREAKVIVDIDGVRNDTYPARAWVLSIAGQRMKSRFGAGLPVAVHREDPTKNRFRLRGVPFYPGAPIRLLFTRYGQVKEDLGGTTETTLGLSLEDEAHANVNVDQKLELPKDPESKAEEKPAAEAPKIPEYTGGAAVLVRALKPDGTPIDHATITSTAHEERFEGEATHPCEGTTNAEGELRWARVGAAVPVTFALSEPGFAPASVTVTLTPDVPEEVIIRAPEPATLVVRTEFGKDFPARFASVRVVQPGGSHPSHAVDGVLKVPQFTNHEGIARFGGMGQGIAEVHVTWLDQHIVEKVAIEASETSVTVKCSTGQK